MYRPANAATEMSKGFQSSPAFGARRAHACVTFVMASLTLATLIVVATVSIEVVKAATLY